MDDYLIRQTQWTIRQIELFTPFTRKFVGYTILAANMLVGFLVWLSLTYTVIETIGAVTGVKAELFGRITVAVMLGVLFFVHIETYFVTTRRLDKKPSLDNLPREIIERKQERKLLFLLSIVFWFIIMMIGSYNAEHGSNYMNILFLYILLEGGLFTRLILEYLFCTKSLPPSEKEKRKHRHVRLVPT